MSEFKDFIAESSTPPTAPPSPHPEHKPMQTQKNDNEAYQRTFVQVAEVEAHLNHHEDGIPQMQDVISLLKKDHEDWANLGIDQKHERLQRARSWLFWIPVGYLQSHQASTSSLVAIARLYAVAIRMEHHLPATDEHYFSRLSISPINEIHRRLVITDDTKICQGRRLPNDTDAHEISH